MRSAAVCAALTACIAAAPTLGDRGSHTNARPRVTLRQLVGQHVMGRFTGKTPSASFLRRIERGELGSVILVTSNITSAPALTQTIAELQSAARRGGNPPLLIAIDQEGGIVKRLPSAPPFESARDLGADGDPSAARRAGRATGVALRALGINVDLAPVLDVTGAKRSFLGSRAFGADPQTVSRVGNAFAAGIQSAGIAATAKHFPGLGTAPADTDGEDVTVTSPRSVLQARWLPFTDAMRQGVALVMVSSARYPALDSSRLPALLSPQIVRGVLRRELGFDRVVITDTMGARSVAAFPRAPVRALRAGVDVLLYSSSEQASAEGYDILDQAARSGAVSRALLRRSYDRVLRLKSRVAR